MVVLRFVRRIGLWLGWAWLVAMWSGCSPAMAAEEPGPSHCFQVAESINVKLAALAGKARDPLVDAGAPPALPRDPRHCWFKAREVFDAVQRLRAQKKLPAAALPAVPGTTLKPKDVLAVAKAALVALVHLDASFPGAKKAEEAPFVTGKTPGDVFASLSEAQLRLESIGAPASGPSDCFQMALCVQAELEAVRTARNVTTPVDDAKPVTGKKPADCYGQARGLLEDLSRIAASDSGLKVRTVAVPANRTDEVKPGHVLDLLSSATADAAAMMLGCGATDPVQLSPAATGKTPSDVFAQIGRARALARSLLPTK